MPINYCLASSNGCEAMSHRGSTRATRKVDRRRRIIDRFEQFARDAERFVHVADFCRLAGINLRTLSRAYREQRYRGAPTRRKSATERGQTDPAFPRRRRNTGRDAVWFSRTREIRVLHRRAIGIPLQTRQRRRSVHEVSNHDAPRVRDDMEGATP